MSWFYVKAALNQLHKNQRGMFSPFMFGLLLAVSSFSVLAMHWAKRDLIRLQEERAARIKSQAEDVAKAVELKIRTETTETFEQDLTLEDLRQHTAKTTGKTRSNENMLLVSRDSENRFDITTQRIAITATDDELSEAELLRRTDAADLSYAAQDGLDPVVIVDTGAIRQQQMSQSIRRLEQMGEQVYQFYAANLRFPTQTEYEELQNVLGLKDVWGEDFYYTYRNDQEALLEFTTPWNYTYPIKLSLKDE